MNLSKKLLDLYQRYSVSSYVTAFSYKPIIDDKNLKDIDFKFNLNHVIKCPPSYCEKMASHSDFGGVLEYSNSFHNDDSFAYE